MKQGVLITGVTGFLGTSLVNHLSSQEGYALFGHTRNPGQAREQFRDYPLEFIKECSREVLDQHNIHTVIHLAGIAHDLSNRYQESDYFAVNFQNTTDVYNAFRESKASKFIFLSSIKAAVDEASAPVGEEVDPVPVSIYGKSKLWAERYILDHLSQDKYVYILRPCMVHGPGNKGNLNLLYKFVKTGLPYPLGAFQNSRSFLNIDNFNFIIDQLISGNISSGIYHLADEGTLSTRELIEVMSSALGKKQLILNIPPRIVRFLFGLYDKKKLQKLTEDMVVSNVKLVKSIGKPLPVSIREGIRKTIRSFNTTV